MADLNCVKIVEVCTIEKGSTGLAKALPGRYPLVATGAERKTSRDYQFDTKAVCIPLVSSTGHGKKTLNYVHYQEGKFALGSILAAIIPKDENVLSARYLHVYLQKNKDRVIVPLMKGAANVSLSIQAISNIEIPIPSVRKQEEIINKIDSISAEHRGLLNESDVQTTIFGKLRQAVLREAIEGKLTAEWRKQNPRLISGENHASKLLERIRAEKERLIKEGKICKERPLPPIIDGEKPFALPNGWTWCRLGSISSFIDYRGKTPTKIKSGVRLVTAKNVRMGTLSLSPEEFISNVEYEARMTRGFPKKDDIFFTTEAPLGNVCLNPFDNNISMGQRIITIQPVLVMSKFLMYELMSKPIQNEIYARRSGITAKGIKSSRLVLIPIAIPPVHEQEAITDCVNRLTTQISMLEKQVSDRKEQTGLLMRSVLREVFEYSYA